MKFLKIIGILVLLSALAVGSVNILTWSSETTKGKVNNHNSSDYLQSEARIITELSHPTMDIRLGYPAIIAPGEAYPSLEVSVVHAGDLRIRIVSEESEAVVEEVTPGILQAGEATTVTFPGIPGEGRYSIRIDQFTDQGLAFRDAYYFTVMDVGQLPSNHSVVVHPGKDGKLVYTLDYRGNRIPDFSRVGYRNGMEIPTIPLVLELEPQEGDDTERIQAAINTVSAMPLNDEGFRGALLLKKGIYEIEGTLHINASGVVLRGEGQGDFKDFWLDPSKDLNLDELRESLSGKDATILIATGSEMRWVIRVEGNEGAVGIMDTATEILDNYVPVGAHSFTVTNAGNFKVGDSIIVERRGNLSWISETGMNSIPERHDGGSITQWEPFDLQFEHIITAIDGNHITIKSSIANAIEKQWGGGRIYKYSDPGRISNSGVENMRAISFWQMNEHGVDDTRHADMFLHLDNIRDGWARNLTLEHFYGRSAVQTGTGSLGVTIKESSNLIADREFYAGEGYDPTGRTFFETGVYTGRYGFHFDGQYGLVKDCYAINNRHAYFVGARVTGPNVFLNSYAEQSLTWSAPHHRWSTGGLFDNVDDLISMMNRLNYGTGHGWAGANYVAWNTGGVLVAEQPPTAQNWAIGHVGEHRDGPFHSWNMERFGLSHGYWESHGVRVEPASLYLKQLEDHHNGGD